MNSNSIFDETTERIDEIGFGGLRLIQAPEEFCYGVDAVILSHMSSMGQGDGSCGSTSQLADAKDTVLVDLGTGTGVVPLILSYKTNISKIYGVEVQQGSFERAERNKELNIAIDPSLESRLHFIQADVKDVKAWAKEHKLSGACDIVTSNPPYFEGGSGLKNDNSPKTIARHETTAKLEDFMKAASLLLKPKGDFYMVHRPSRLVDICEYGRRYKLEPKEIQFVAPKEGEEPNILLVHFVKNGGKQLKFLKILAVHKENGDYTEELLACYK